MSGYAVDRLSPARYVASELARAAPAAVPLEELVAGYSHPNPGDLARITRHESGDPVTWLIQVTLAALARNGAAGRVQVVHEDNGFRLADGLSFADLRFENRQLTGLVNEHAQFGDPFNPMSGPFSDNVRTDKVAAAKDGMDELRESMRALGWVPEFPALVDERGVVLTGHRRLRVAAELRAEGLDIPDQVRELVIGSGDEADARRWRIALASNNGFKPLSPTDRKVIAENLYAGGWTMARIGVALAVSQKTISKDLEFIPMGRNRRAKDGSRRGRPKGTRNQAPPASQAPSIVTHVAEIQALMQAGAGEDLFDFGGLDEEHAPAQSPAPAPERAPAPAPERAPAPAPERAPAPAPERAPAPAPERAPAPAPERAPAPAPERAPAPAPERAPAPAPERAPARPRVAPPELEQAIHELVLTGQPVNRLALAEEYGVGEHQVQLLRERAVGAVTALRREQERAQAAAAAAEAERLRSAHLLSEWREAMDRTVQEYREAPPVVLDELVRRLSDLFRAL